MNLDLARAVADTVLYEGYLLYPYRASSDKNRVRWQFGVLGPPGAADAGHGEPESMTMQCLLTRPARDGRLEVRLRFLQLQRRQVYDGAGTPVDELRAEGQVWTSWDEAVERELVYPLDLGTLIGTARLDVAVDGGQDTEELPGDGRVVRRRWPLAGELAATLDDDSGFARLTLTVRNTTVATTEDRDEASRFSFLGAHLIVAAHGAGFVSLQDPPAEAAGPAASCRQDRCWPVLAGAPGDTDLLLGSPIILYDYAEVAAESPAALFDSTEIDELLTLRVLTMTDAEKAEARATDPRAREIVDRCEGLSPDELRQLHGAFRDPRGPASETVTIAGVPVSEGSLVRVHPRRRADAQDMFYAGQVARVTAVRSDVDGGVHVAVVLADDEAADLHDWYGRYWYFAPDELEPLAGRPGRLEDEHPHESRHSREETRS